MTTADPVISLENVTKRYGDVLAVAAASFDVGRAELFSVLGPSGCGKTTLLRIIAGFEDATSGRVLLEGADVSRTPPFRRNVNTVFQQYALFPHLSVFENVAFGPRTKGLAEAETESRVRRMLDVVRLGDFGDRRPDQLSGGQKQRVALARALVNSPSALLLDEPLSALDLKLRQAMQLELKRIQREVGITFLFVTHDQEEALTMSDRIAVMNEGGIEQIGTPEEIYGSPVTAFVAGFIGTANLLPADAGEGMLVMVRPENVRLTTEAPTDGDSALSATIVELVFAGPVVRCVLRAEAGQTILANLGPDAAGTGLERGRKVYATWRRENARLVRG